jgi:hypothetical protein
MNEAAVNKRILPLGCATNFLANSHLHRESRQPGLSHKCEDLMNPGTVHRSPGTYLTDEKDSGLLIFIKRTKFLGF